MTGAWSCIIRFACHIPLGWVSIGGRGLYDTVNGLDATGIYDVIPNGRSFLYGLQMYSTWGIFAFAWNLVMFLGCFGCSSYLLALLGLIDSMIAVSLSISAVKQALFIPRTYGACDEATNWRNGTDGRNYFLTANSTAFDTYGGPARLCHAMVETWAFTVSVVILYGITGLINVALGLGTAYSSHKGCPLYCNSYGYRKWLGGGYRKALCGSLLWLLTPALWILDHPLAACRFGFRYICKALDRRRGQKDRRAVQHGRKALASKYSAEKRVDTGEPPVLPSEILLMISQQVHFVDLVSATRASKKLRMILFGSEGLVPGQLEDLREFSCQGTEKTSCEICGIQTCPDCQTKIAVASSPTSRHLRECRPYCSKCFYKTYCRWWAPQGQRLAKHRATCQLREQQTDVEMAVTAATTTDTKTLCRMCASMTQAERRKRLEARDEPELDRLERHPLACSKCRGMLSTRGPRWWICWQCLTECPSHLHPAWAEK
ncbi:hypothetical protein DL771_010093 [Monosporascus sp. 5C6A]|nr:hypothetical protein DL771_010093 [Monosporascus sp. 5C6A]